MERRKHRRIPAALTVLFVTPDMGGVGLKKGGLRNLSSAGCAVGSGIAVEVGTDLALFIQVPRQVNTIKVDQATVQWALDGEFGLAFRNQRPEEQERLRLWLATEHEVA